MSDTRLDVVEARLEDLREGQRETNARFDAFQQQINTRFDTFQQQFNARFDRLLLALLAVGVTQIGVIITLVIRGN